MTEPSQFVAESSTWNPPISVNWRKDCRRNGAAIISLFLIALLAWITASQTFIVLSGSKLVHPSSLGWPLYICIAGALLGSYIFAAADRKWMPIPGREYEKPDHSLKYSLWFKDIAIEWLTYSDEPDKIYALVGIWISNGGRNSPIVVEVEKLDVVLNGVTPTSSGNYIPLRFLPDQTKRFLSSRLDHIPHGNAAGEISYSLKYGPVSGFPVYRRTHKISFQLRTPIDPAVVKSGGASSWLWTELEPELDTDMNPPPQAGISDFSRPSEPITAGPQWYGVMGPPDQGYDLLGPSN